MSLQQKMNSILDKNKINDLEKFIEKKHCLNTCNSYLIYLFHTIQSAGILTTAVGTGYNRTDLSWIGIGLTVSASLINIYEHINNTMSLTLMKDINALTNNCSLDEDITNYPLQKEGSLLTVDSIA